LGLQLANKQFEFSKKSASNPSVTMVFSFGGGVKPYLLLDYSRFGKFERHSQPKAGNPANSLLSFLLESTEILPFVILKPLGLGIQPMLIVGGKGACSPAQPKISSFSALALGIRLMLKIAGIENVNQIIIQSAGSPKLRFEDDGEFVGNTNQPNTLNKKTSRQTGSLNSDLEVRCKKC